MTTYDPDRLRELEAENIALRKALERVSSRVEVAERRAVTAEESARRAWQLGSWGGGRRRDQGTRV